MPNNILKKCFLFTVIFIQIVSAHAQQSFKEDLKSGNKYLFKKLDSADFFARKAFPEATNALDRGKVYQLIGRINFYKGDSRGGRDTLRLGYELTKNIDTTKDCTREKILNSIGETYKDEQKYDSAKLYYDSAMASLKKDSTYTNLTQAMLLNNMGELLLFQNQNDSALPYFQRAGKILNGDTSTAFQRVLGYVYESMGRYYETVNNFGSAKDYLNKSLKIRNAQKNTNSYEYILIAITIGIFDQEHRNYKVAKDNLDYNQIAKSEILKYNTPAFATYLTNHFISMYKNEAKLNKEAKDAEQAAHSANKTLIYAFSLVVLFLILFIIIAQKRQNLLQDINQLNTIGEDISKSLTPADTDISGLVSSLYNNIKLLVDAPIVTIALLNKDTGYLDYYGFEKGIYQKYRSRSLDMKDSIIVNCFESGEDEIIGNYEASSYHKAFIDEGETPKSVAAFPLIINKKKIGVFSVQSYIKNTYRGKDELLKNLSSKIAMTINNFLTNEKLYETNAGIAAVLSILKHDLPYPVRTLEALQDPDISETLIRSHLKSAYVHLEQLLELLNKLDLEMTKLMMPVTSERIQTFFFQSINSEYEEFYTQQGTILSIEENDLKNLGEFISDKNLIRFVLKNFITNAFKAIENKKKKDIKYQGMISVRIKLEKAEELLTINVTDNGEGLKENGEAEKFSIGSGKALLLSKQLIENYNLRFLGRAGSGQIVTNITLVKNENGIGSTATLRLPVIVLQLN